MEKNSENTLQESIKTLVYNLHNEYGWFNEEELKNTPRRIENFYREWYGTRNFTFTKFKVSGHESMVIMKNISFYSMCSHHLLPFFWHNKCSLPAETLRIHSRCQQTG